MARDARKAAREGTAPRRRCVHIQVRTPSGGWADADFVELAEDYSVAELRNGIRVVVRDWDEWRRKGRGGL